MIIGLNHADEQYTVFWFYQNGEHKVRYGKDIKTFTGEDADIRAAEHYGLCVRHQAECAGLLS